jgi:REP element-mobilizing transposase RayT
MVLAHHLILTAYGFWLPNDDRGSWSDFIRRWELLRFGPATKTDVRQSVARKPFSPSRRVAATRELTYQPVMFTGEQALLIARACADGVRRSGYVVYACAILPDHVHLVIRRHAYRIEQVANRLKGSATRFLTDAGVHPMLDQVGPGCALPSPWGVGLWKVFLDSPEDIRRAIDYVEANPVKAGKKKQQWSFVVSYGI